MKKLVISSRASDLALWQSEYVKARLLELRPELEIEIQTFVTRGDQILDKPLALIGGKGLFTKEVEEAMLNGTAHIAVHSLKDVPVVTHDDLHIAAITKREDPRDMFLSDKFENFDSLPKGAVVGTTSLRRRMQVLKLRPDLVVKDLRGNVNTRLKKLNNGEYDAIILATAGIKRLGFYDKVQYTQELDENHMIPSMGQGALAVETIKNEAIIELVEQLNDKAAFIETSIEREFVKTLDGGCQVPIAIKATYLNENEIKIKTMVGLPTGKEILEQSVVCTEAEYQGIGKSLADELIAKGAKEILAHAKEIAFT